MRLFDELNTPSESKILPIEQYFDEMELPKGEKEERKEFAESMVDIMLFIFAFFSIMKEYGYMNKQYVISQLQVKYSEVILRYMNIDDEIEKYIQEFSEKIIDTTSKHSDEEFYLSDDRAVLVSVNESNSILGYKQLQEAKRKGYTKKTWITERDRKVRKTHREVDRMTIPLDDYFLVGNSLMAYPHDLSAEEKETANCRCTLSYS